MPPELLPRDRKELFRERKNERSLSEGGGLNRLRDVRRPGGYVRGFPMLSEESFRGSGPSRSNDKMLDDERKYGRSGRENRGVAFSQRGLNRHLSDAAANSSLNGPASMQFDVNDKRLVDDVLTCNQIELKDTHDKSGGISGSSTGQKVDGENTLSSIDWKTLKWTRSGSMSSRGSGLSHSSSSKSMGVDSTETKFNLHPQNASPLQSPSCDAAAACASPAAAGASVAATTEEISSRKKPRLGWGEGLAKFEKKKVDSPSDTAVQNGMLLSENNKEHRRSHVINVPDRSPRLAGLLSCTSPATPSSVACSSSQGIEDKSLGKAVNIETANLCGSPSESLNQCEDLSCNLVTLEETPLANLYPLINDLLQCNDQGSMDSDFVKSSVVNKLLVLKADVSKRIEATESEIDSLETELKLLISDTVSASVHPHPASSSSLPVVCFNKLSEVGSAPNLIPRPDPLQTSGDLMDRTYGAFEGELPEGKQEDIDSPGTATSKFSEATYVGKPIFEADVPNPVESLWNVSACKNDCEVKSLVYGVEEEGTDNCHMHPDNVGEQTENMYDQIMVSNKESAHRASEVFSKLVPSNLSSFHIPIVDNSPCLDVHPLVEEKFAMRKRFMKFKERVITLKFRVFQHLWKEDLRLLSIKRSRTKPQKKFEFGTRMLPCGYQKHRASIRSRFSSPAGNLSLVPTTQVINFASKLLEDSRTKVYRSSLNMPPLILDNKEKIMSRFISSNGLVEDPCSLEKERFITNPWTSEEKEIFLDKLSIFGKDFRKIASFLDNKTTADCVEFYYKNHKSECFQKAKKKPEFAEKGKSYSKNTYLVTSSKRWNRDNNAASLDLLGAASAIAANDDDGLKNQKFTPRLIFGSCNSRIARGDDVMSKRPSAINILGSERENVAADVLAGICGSLSSEAMSSCITSSIDIGEGYQERKCQPMRLKKRRSVTPEVAQDVDEGTCSDESCGEVDHANWTDEERSVFVQAVSSYGKDFAMISQCVRTKSSTQCKVFFSKARKCLGLDMMHPGSCSGGASLSDNTNGGGGADMEDASLVESGSGVKLDSKTDDDLSLSSLKAVQTEISPVGTINIHPDTGKSKKIDNAGELDVVIDELGPEDVHARSKNKNACLVLDGDNDLENSDGSESQAAKILENGFGPHSKTGQNEDTESGSQEKSAVIQEVNDIVKPCTNEASGVYVHSSRAGEAGTEFSLHGNSFNEKGLQVAPLSNGNVPLSASTNLSATGTLPGSQQINPINLDAAPLSVLQTPIAVQTQKSLNLTSISDSGKTSNTHLKISVGGGAEDGYNKPLYQQSSMDHINPMNSLQAYPQSIPTKKVLNGDIGAYKPTPSQSISKLERNLCSEHLLPQDSHLPKSNGHGPKRDMRSELHVLSEDQLKENSRKPRPRCLSDSDQPTRKGDVKLFGQILSHPSTQQKPTSRAEEKEDRDAKHAKSSENSYNLKITSAQNLNGILASTKFDHNTYLGLRDMGVPVRSFGYWDGNRIQTGFPSVPDSAILLAKYPAAFGNYPPSSSNVEQQQLHRISDCSLNGVSVMPARELSGSKGVTDYQAYMNCDGAKVQPFAVDLKQQQNGYYTEMQRQRRGSEFDGVPSVQQQRGMLGLDVLGRGGILHGGGGPRNTVSDPVAAIRRHYAGEQYNGQIGSIIREETWRSNGNVGR